MTSNAPDALYAQAVSQVDACESLVALDDIRVHYLGKSGVITQYLQQVGKLPPAERAETAKTLNTIKSDLQDRLQKRKQFLERVAMESQLAEEAIDVTLHGRHAEVGHLHPIRQVTWDILEYFKTLGFVYGDGAEIEDDEHNFTHLNIPPHHPARAMQDTFYIEKNPQHLLRTHTSPLQIRYLREQALPIRMVTVGRVYRRDVLDPTHTPMFHQFELLCVDETCAFGDLKHLMTGFLKHFFNHSDLTVRFRPSYFPFTEPSAEVDMTCVACSGKKIDCGICKGTGWLEIFGCGMVHPNVLKVGNIDTDRYRGYAVGLGIDRLAMLKYKVNDLRLFFENDLDFLKQF